MPDEHRPTPPREPTTEDRRRAACRAMAGAPGLVRFAARFTRSLHDAEDAYQRAMEIALTRAPTVEPKRFAAWLHTVLRNEALAVAAARRREGPAPDEDVADAVAGRDADGGETHAVVEWRERYRSLQDALASLTESQRVCVMPHKWLICRSFVLLWLRQWQNRWQLWLTSRQPRLEPVTG